MQNYYNICTFTNIFVLLRQFLGFVMVILAIETSSPICSAAILKDQMVLDARISTACSNHAVMLPTMVDELMHSHPHTTIQAIALAEGPGSYTGLRIGTSLAKGLAYGMGIPMVGIGTLRILAEQVIQTHSDLPQDALLCPMLDARRMEVYTALYDIHGQEISKVEAKIIDSTSYQDRLAKQPIFFFGDGAEKCKQVLQHPHAHFMDDIQLDARYMGGLAETKLAAGAKADVAYFCPFYLKDFVAAPSHIKGLK